MISVYILVSAVIYAALRARCAKNAVFRPPASRTIFYLLSFTWGLPYTLFGCAAAAYLRFIRGYRPSGYGWAWCFEIPDIKWGLELGIFFIAPAGDEYIKRHEYGHAIQNALIGIFSPAVISLPSAIRFHYRAARAKAGRPCASGYDDVWFERSATETGTAAIMLTGGKYEGNK